jgi:hypothetical protein
MLPMCADRFLIRPAGRPLRGRSHRDNHRRVPSAVLVAGTCDLATPVRAVTKSQVFDIEDRINRSEIG